MIRRSAKLSNVLYLVHEKETLPHIKNIIPWFQQQISFIYGKNEQQINAQLIVNY